MYRRDPLVRRAPPDVPQRAADLPRASAICRRDLSVHPCHWRSAAGPVGLPPRPGDLSIHPGSTIYRSDLSIVLSGSANSMRPDWDQTSPVASQ